MSKKPRRGDLLLARKSKLPPSHKRTSEKTRQVHPEAVRGSGDRSKRKNPRQVHPELAVGSNLNPPAGGKWVSDWGGIIQSYELEPSSEAEAFKAAIEAGVSAFEARKDNLLAVLRSASERDPKSQPFDEVKAWDRLSRLAWQYFWRKRVKQETRLARDRSKQLRKIANVLNKANRFFDKAQQDTLIDDLYSAWCDLIRGDALPKEPLVLVRFRDEFAKVLAALTTLETATLRALKSSPS